MEKEVKKLYRSRENRIIWGVAGGLAKYFEIDFTLMRLILAAFVFITGGLGAIFYIFAAIIIPNESGGKSEAKQESAGAADSTQSKRKISSGGLLVGLIIFIIGLFVLIDKFFPFYWIRWGLVWPILLMVLGLVIIVRAGRK